jgi:hypothetical protein
VLQHRTGPASNMAEPMPEADDDLPHTSDHSLPAEAQYPEIGEVPEYRHLTACEVLCWIGYRRAIAKDVYFAPLTKARANGTAREVALLHRSIPEPKPSECPINDAERELMKSLRDGRVHAMVAKNGRLAELPSEIYEYSVSVNVRGSIEADAGSGQRDYWLALEYMFNLRPPIGEVLFRTTEVMTAWPNNGADRDEAPTAPLSPAPAPDPSQKPAFHVGRAKLLLMVEKAKGGIFEGRIPTESEVRALLVPAHFKGCGNEALRQAMRHPKLWPGVKRGTRRKSDSAK